MAKEKTSEVLESPIAFETVYSLGTNVDVVRLSWSDLRLINHIGELFWLSGLEFNWIQSIVLKCSQLDRSGWPIIVLSLEFKCFRIHVVKLSKFLFILLCIVLDFNTDFSWMHLNFKVCVLHVIVITFQFIAFMLELIIDWFLFRNWQKCILITEVNWSVSVLYCDTG